MSVLLQLKPEEPGRVAEASGQIHDQAYFMIVWMNPLNFTFYFPITISVFGYGHNKTATSNKLTVKNNCNELLIYYSYIQHN